jgi:pimeloyl-ACP methyl ester carboxylesterase
MKIFHFGRPARRLVGLLHASTQRRPVPAAVLLCNPFGEEAVRAHRTYRVLATQLDQHGYPTLRFDYYGTGDSMGESGDVSIAGWIEDITTAAKELSERTSARYIMAVGLRLGATLAALAASRAALRLRHLVLWDPIIDGNDYLRELASMHQAYMHHELGWRGDRAASQALSGHSPAEALGTPIGAGLAAEIRAIDLTTEALHSGDMTLVSTRETKAVARLRDRFGDSSATSWIGLPASAPWNSDAALNASVVPADAVRAIVARIDAVQ